MFARTSQLYLQSQCIYNDVNIIYNETNTGIQRWPQNATSSLWGSDFYLRKYAHMFKSL